MAIGSRRRPILGLAAVLLTPILASCASAPTRLFTLEPVAPAAGVSSYAGPVIRVEGVRVPPTLDRIEILTDVAPGELKIDDSAHWGAPLGQLVHQAVTADLAMRLPGGCISYGHPAKTQGAIRLDVDIMAFSVGGNEARLDAGWTVTSDPPTDARPPARSGARTVALHTHTVGDGATARAGALSVLLGQLTDLVAADLSARAGEFAEPGNHCAAYP